MRADGLSREGAAGNPALNKENIMNDQNDGDEPKESGAIDEKANRDFLVVGLGASAGGIKAFKDFFSHVPADSGMAYVVILHLSPDHESKLAEILQLASRIPVTQVEDRVVVEPNHVYVIPPNKSLSMKDGHLALSEIKGFEERRAPVDIFFRTLAEANESRAACVILSGTGPNGSMGLKRIKEKGGIALAQDPKEAEYADMPRNAIATGFIDYILPVADIPAKIIAYKENLGNISIPPEPLERPEADEQALRDIFTQLRVRTGHDFSNYKRATVLRRIERRINVHELPDLPAYTRYMDDHPEEAQALLKDLLISVTNFFRDAETFKALEHNVIPKIFEGEYEGDSVRVWVPGCATGEEAYSLAMLLAEYSANSLSAPSVQVFATDIDEQAIAYARDGFYTDADVADVSPERLRRFFTKESDGYRVRRDLREMVLFASHNLIKDPPFSHLHLVSCRNLLIYLNRTAQDRAMEVLHFALRPGGFLYLGLSESVNGATDLFLPFDKENHIYLSRAVATRMSLPIPDLPLTARVDLRAREERTQETKALERLSYVDLHQRMLEQYGPPSVVVNENYDIVHLSEHAGRYLQLAGGEPSHNLLKIVRPELRLELRTALHQATQRQTSVEARGLLVNSGELINLIVHPVFREGDPARGFILVIFDEVAKDAISSSAAIVASVGGVEPAVRHLEDELERVKAQLRATVEQYEVQHEELKASNEELQAMNEELRSAAEELETGKEELQSVNEELTTVNQELKIKIEELSQANNDFQNLMASTEIGTIFLDRSLRVKLFTPRAREIFNLIPADINRPLLDISHKLDYEGFLSDIDRVLDKLLVVEREVQTHEGRWYQMRMLPYRTTEDRIDGVVITLVDITGRKQNEVAVHERDEQLALAQRAARVGFWQLDLERDLSFLGEEWREIMGFTEATEPKTYTALLRQIHPEDRLRFDETHKTAMHDKAELNVEFRINHPELGERWILSRGRKVSPRNGSDSRLHGVVMDITERKKIEDELRRTRDRLEMRVRERTAELEKLNQALRAEVTERSTTEKWIRDLLRQIVTAQEDERGRIARDLHDRMGQQLTVLKLKLESLNSNSGTDGDTKQVISETHAIANRLDSELTFLAWELRPAVLDDLGLVAALANFVQEWSKHHGIAAEFHTTCSNEDRFSAEVETTLYRITQEALNNVFKHSDATHVEVLVERRGDNAVLIVEDNGKGFEVKDNLPNKRDTNGMGLIGMRERAMLAGGDLEIESSPGKGATIFVRIPSNYARD
jgi:two-component system CheB/CheR fusion protein